MELTENRGALSFLDDSGMISGVVYVHRRRLLENEIRKERHKSSNLVYFIHVGCWDCFPEMWGRRLWQR